MFFFTLSKFIPWVRLDPMVGRFWPTGRMFGTPGLELFRHLPDNFSGSRRLARPIYYECLRCVIFECLSCHCTYSWLNGICLVWIWGRRPKSKGRKADVLTDALKVVPTVGCYTCHYCSKCEKLLISDIKSCKHEQQSKVKFLWLMPVMRQNWSVQLSILFV